MSVVLPEWVARNERRRQLLEANSPTHRHNEDWKVWNRLLREIDARLSYVFVPELEDPPPGVVPLRWHVVRVNEAGPDSYWPLLDEDGQFREMGSRDVEDFKGRDLWDPAVRHELATLRRRRLESKERGRETKREARRDEIALNVKALESPGVSFGDGRWSNRPTGRRGRKR